MQTRLPSACSEKVGEFATFGGAVAPGFSERLGETEVEHLDRAVPLGQLDVGRLEVAVDDPALVRVLERLGDLARE